MRIHFISGLNGDRIQVINDEEQVANTFYFGYNASWTRQFARFAHQDVVDAERYGWKTPYVEKPFIGDVLPQNWKELKWTGHNVFNNSALSTEYLEAIKDCIKAEE